MNGREETALGRVLPSAVSSLPSMVSSLPSAVSSLPSTGEEKEALQNLKKYLRNFDLKYIMLINPEFLQNQFAE